MKASDPKAVHGIPEAMLRDAVPIGRLKFWPGNPRQHARAKLRASLREFGQPKQVVAQTGTDRVFAGNGILEAALDEGWTHIAVTFIDWPDLKARQFLLADNKMHDEGGDDVDALARFLAELHAEGGIIDAIGFEQREVDRFLASLSETGPDADIVPEVKAEDVWVKPGDLFALGDHRLLVADAMDADHITRLFGGQMADCVFTSPPYAVGVDYGELYEDSLPNLRALISGGAELWQRTVAPGGFAVINFGDIASGRIAALTDEPCEYPMAIEYWPVFRAAGWLLWSRRVWCKPNPRVHAPWSIQSNRAATDFEHVWTWKRPGDPIIRRVDGRYASPNGWFDTTHEEGVDVGKEVHGAGMATSAAVRMLAIHSRRGAIVHEPFAGTGTTLIAAHMLERRCYATELNPRFAQITLTRWERFAEAKAEKL